MSVSKTWSGFLFSAALGLHVSPYVLRACLGATGQGSVWLAKSLTRMVPRLGTFLGVDTFVYSTHGNSKRSKSMARPQNCLPTVGVSTVGLLVLSAGWAYASKQNGGLDDPSRRDAAQEFFRAMIFPLTQLPSAFCFTVELVPDWECRFPRPQPYAASTVQLRIEPQGVLSLEELRSRATGAARVPVAAAWWKELKSRLSRVPTAPLLADFLSKTIDAGFCGLCWCKSCGMPRSISRRSGPSRRT